MKFVNLNNQHINDFINEVKRFAQDKAINSKDLLRSLLIIEDALLEIMNSRDYAVPFKYAIRKRPRRVSIRIIFKNKNLPFIATPKSVLQENLYKDSKIKPKYLGSGIHQILVVDIPVYENLFLGNIRFNWKYMKDKKAYLIIALFLQLLSVGLNVLIPVLTATIIVAYTDNIFIDIIATAIAIVLAWLIDHIGTYYAGIFYNKVYFEVRKNLSLEISNTILKLENSCIESKGSGVFTQRLTTDLQNICLGLATLINHTTILIKFIGILIAMFIFAWESFCYVLLGLIICIIIEQVRAHTMKKKDRTFRQANDEYSSFIVEMVHGIKDIKLLNSRPNFIVQLKKRVLKANDRAEEMYASGLKYTLTKNSFGSIWSFGFMIILAYSLLWGWMSPAIALVLYSYNSSLGFNVLTAVQNLYDFVRDFNLSGERLFSLIDNWEYPREKYGTKHLDKINGQIEFKNVNFSYKHKDLLEKNVPVLNNVNLKIHANTTVALVGRSGTGKSTIASLITKLEEVYDGQILIDNYSIKDLDEETIRTNISMVSQIPHFFNISIKDNLKLIKPSATDEELVDVCKQAYIYEEIMTFNDGMDTIIGENGVNLSGGQRQRLSIARSLLNKTKIYILDEATSALDNVTQDKVMQAINKLRGKSTILIIAHRLSTIKNADLIFFVKNGSIDASGTHEELLKKCKDYKELYEGETN